MKNLKISMSMLAIFALLFTSCSKEESVAPGDDPNVQSVELTFGAILNDLSNRAMASASKAHFDQIPTCLDDAEPAVARIGFSYGGDSYVIDVDILSDEDGYFTDYAEELKIPVPNNGSVEVTLDSFRVYDGDPDGAGNLIWIAPIESEEGEFDGYVDSALPFSFQVQDGTKPYIDVEVLCFDRRMVNEYGYPFFDIIPGKIYPLCFFANFCPPSGRHYVANYSVDLFYDDGTTRIQLYDGDSPDLDDTNDSADPLCLVVPESPFEDPDEDYLFYVITPEDWTGNYGNIDNTPLVEVGLSWNDVNGLLNNDGETAEYIHLFIGCDTPIDDCPGVPVPGDRDGDCIPDEDDECPDEPGTVPNFGCPDDPCPGTDPDGDGLFGECDECPDEAGTSANFGCPLDDCTTDTDGDGVADCNDECPDTQGPAENDGCPEDDDDETCETAFMFGDTAINTFDDVTRWGWAEQFTSGQGETVLTIWAGAGQNQTSKGVAVGTATVSVDGDGDVHLEIEMDSGYSLEELHVNLSDSEPSGSVAKAPGQYNMNSIVDAGTLEYEFTGFEFTGDFWIIVHTVTCGVEDDD